MDLRFTLLLACFFLSGFAALLYQTVWTRELSFVFGTSELAVAAVLAAYMGGLALGAAAAARYALRLRRPVLVYGILELSIAVSALLVPTGIRLINWVYLRSLGGGAELTDAAGTAAAIFQLGAAFAVLLPPTAFMGATLPLLARHAVRSESEIGSRVGLLYAVNTAGAIAGTLCAAFLLMPELGLRQTVWVGAALNGLVFGLAAWLARGATDPTAPAPLPVSQAGMGAAVWILPAIGISGAVSFIYEVLWTRLLGHLLGASLDAFATMLASFLLGIALGSAAAARHATSRERAAVGFGLAQLGIAFTTYVAFTLSDRLPELSYWLGAGPGAPLASAAVAAAALLPITLCIGATFPFAVRLLAQSPEQAAAATARAYAWNTLGAIVGALGAGFVLLPGLGFAGTVSVGIVVNLVLAALCALALRPRRRWLAGVAVAGMILLIVLPAKSPWNLLSSSPLSRRTRGAEILYAAVGRSATILLFDWISEFRLTSNGLPEATIEGKGVLPRASVQRWLGLLPALLRPEARELLIVGLGGGVALEPIPSSIESVDVVELEPEVLVANRLMAPDRTIDPLADPRVRIHLGDARGVLQLTAKRFDAIVSQPSHPWTAGASHLYTREFFSLVRSRLTPDGVFVQWIGLGYLDEALLRSLTATLVDAFGNVEIFQPSGTAGLLFAASPEPLDSLAGARRALEISPDDFARFGFHRVEDFAAARVLDDVGSRALAEGGELNTDDHNHLASRASRLGDAVLDLDAARALWRDHEPLLSGAAELDSSALIRELVASRFPQRATALALAEEGAAQERALGWTELGLARPGRAARHFQRALEQEPGSRDAIAGLVASHPLAFKDGRSVAGISEHDLDDALGALVVGWRYAETKDWDSVAALDARIAGIAPGEALFEEASRLRIAWRLAAGRPEDASEAQALAEVLLVRDWSPQDSLLRARAAIAAGRPQAAWASLIRIAGLQPGVRSTSTWAERARNLAETLPEPFAQSFRDRLAAAMAAASANSPKSPPE